ncbi:hypothetical protein RKD32_006793 [Streptomyces sp. SAI-195]|uniref:hypothetical protein n=1 Tax=Streptomyces sp. SAI-163 TaxID=3377735 RepID=UPI003C7B1AAD
MASALAAQQHAAVTVTDLRPFPDDDPRGAGFTAAALPMVIGGMIPAVALSRLFPGCTGLRRRLTGAFALVAGFAVTVVLHYGTGSLSGDYLATSLGVVLGLAALVMPLIGLESLLGMAGFGLGAVMFLGNPLRPDHRTPLAARRLGHTRPAPPSRRLRQPPACQRLLRRRRRRHPHPRPRRLDRPGPDAHPSPPISANAAASAARP